jgi:hypothetical protein
MMIKQLRDQPPLCSAHEITSLRSLELFVNQIAVSVVNRRMSAASPVKR